LLTGNCYVIGLGVIKDEIEGLAWYYLSVAQGEEDAMQERAKIERRVGAKASVFAQQRSREIEKEISDKRRLYDNGKLNDERKNLPKATGSGVVVSYDGYILTAAHVIGDSKRVRIISGETSYDGQIVKIEKELDIALIKCGGGFIPACSAPGSPDTSLLITRHAVKGPRTKPAEPVEG
jgi:S1-C subfamily serine protease